MNNRSEQIPGNENIKIENDFLKMKLMLERGAVFGMGNSKDLPAEIEHEFLKNIMEFEKQADEHKTIRVFDKIGKPKHFKPVAKVPEEKIEKAWEDLTEYLKKHNINLDVCSPNITTKELYRFVIEELFEYKMDDIDMPGMTHNFIYDEFHPDTVYENTVAATDECIRYILQKKPMEWTHHFGKDNLQLNQHTSLSEEELKIIVNMFKRSYDDLKIKEIKDTGCIVKGNKSRVKGTYKVIAYSGKETCVLSGIWEVFFKKDDRFGFWNINNVQVEGIGL